MSLINDALKRAKAVQDQVPPPATPGPQFRPAEAERYARQGVGLMVPVAFAVVALLALLLVWSFHRGRSTGTQQVADVQAQVQPQPAPAAPEPVSPADPPPSPGASGPVAPPAQAGSSPASAVTTTVAVGVPPAPAAAVIPPPPAISQPPPPKLQGIVFNSRRSSALISGKTLFIGDYLGDLRLVAIGKNTATLSAAGQNIVLTLEQ